MRRDVSVAAATFGLSTVIGLGQFVLLQRLGLWHRISPVENTTLLAAWNSTSAVMASAIVGWRLLRSRRSLWGRALVLLMAGLAAGAVAVVVAAWAPAQNPYGFTLVRDYPMATEIAWAAGLGVVLGVIVAATLLPMPQAWLAALAWCGCADVVFVLAGWHIVEVDSFRFLAIGWALTGTMALLLAARGRSWEAATWGGFLGPAMSGVIAFTSFLYWAQRYYGDDCHNSNGAECYSFNLSVAGYLSLLLLIPSAVIAAMCAVPGRLLSARGASDDNHRPDRHH